MKFRLNKVLKTVSFIALLLVVVAINKNSVQAAEADGTITAELASQTGDNMYEGTIDKDAQGQRTSVVAVTTNYSGLLMIAYNGKNKEDVSLKLFSDKELTKQVGNTETLEALNHVIYTDPFIVSKAGTYYILLTSKEKVDVSYIIAAFIYSAEDGTLKNGVKDEISLLGPEDSNFYKITVPKTGYVTLYTAEIGNFTGDTNPNVAIYKSVGGKKKQLSSGHISQNGASFALTKGTYYFKIYKGIQTRYEIYYEFNAVTDNSGSKKSEARAFTFGKEKDGLILATDKTSKADWYKVNNETPRKVDVIFNGKVNGTVTMELFDAKGKSFGKISVNQDTPREILSLELPKGTYYMKVTKKSKNVTGYYTLIMNHSSLN